MKSKALTLFLPTVRYEGGWPVDDGEEHELGPVLVIPLTHAITRQIRARLGQLHRILTVPQSLRLVQWSIRLSGWEVDLTTMDLMIDNLDTTLHQGDGKGLSDLNIEHLQDGKEAFVLPLLYTPVGIGAKEASYDKMTVHLHRGVITTSFSRPDHSQGQDESNPTRRVAHPDGDGGTEDELRTLLMTEEFLFNQCHIRPRVGEILALQENLGDISYTKLKDDHDRINQDHERDNPDSDHEPVVYCEGT